MRMRSFPVCSLGDNTLYVIEMHALVRFSLKKFSSIIFYTVKGKTYLCRETTIDVLDQKLRKKIWCASTESSFSSNGCHYGTRDFQA